MLTGLASLFGGGSGIPGMDNNSSASQSTPFYNSAGIYFRSSGSGGIEAGDSSASASTVPRALSGGNQAYPDSQIGYGYGPSTQNNGLIYAIIGGILLLSVGAFFAFKK